MRLMLLPSAKPAPRGPVSFLPAHSLPRQAPSVPVPRPRSPVRRRAFPVLFLLCGGNPEADSALLSF